MVAVKQRVQHFPLLKECVESIFAVGECVYTWPGAGELRELVHPNVHHTTYRTTHRPSDRPSSLLFRETFYVKRERTVYGGTCPRPSGNLPPALVRDSSMSSSRGMSTL